jgi:DNA topoisomerase II
MGKKNDKIKSKKNNNTKPKKIEDIYKKYTHYEHIFNKPGMYIGSVVEDTRVMRVYDHIDGKIINRLIMFVPGLYKIYDEILVNSRDHSIRDKTCNKIAITIDKVTGRITIHNTGHGLPIEIHKDHGIYVPELILGNLLTSSNYEEKGKIVGGTNGLGAKLTNIYSVEFVIDTCCAVNNKTYHQRFYDNMTKKDAPIIESVDKKTKPYTTISFIPDYAKFGMKDGITDDVIALFEKRAYDVAGCTDDRVKVYLNGKKINIVNFREYIDMFYDGETIDLDKDLIYESTKRWDVGVVYDPSAGYCHNTYVNGICTYNGGTHLNNVVDNIVHKLMKVIKQKHPKLQLKPAFIKEHMSVYINCSIEDPGFNSQVKEELTNKVADFGSKYEPTDEFIKKLSKSGIIDDIVKLAELKELASLQRISGKKRSNLKGITKYEPAQDAGTRQSKHCRLFLTEGDSAKTFVISGLEVIGHKRYGVFPLKGKLLNVREAPAKKIKENEEIKNVVEIMGIKLNKVYTKVDELRYGGIVIMTDQDVDGIHIKGLIMNFFHVFCPSLLKIPGFIQCMSTPIVKAWKKTDKKKVHIKEFYNLTEYDQWVESVGANITQWETKYYKGLGTSDPDEARKSFDDFDKKLISYVWETSNKTADADADVDDDKSTNSAARETASDDTDDESVIEDDDLEQSESIIEDDVCDQAMKLGFAKQFADKRKIWLKTYDKNIIVDPDLKKIPITDFVNKELIHFSTYDNVRSIPKVHDGLKPSQRKVLYAAFKRKLDKNEIKVSQFAGYIAENTEYHHGEASLNGTIINMAQNYVGSNNINLLNPVGGFGTRRLGGKDAASPRYIFTSMNELTSLIFRPEDNVILKKQFEDGIEIEPENFEPIIPMVLLNGIDGIGTGYNSKCPCFSPERVINNLIRLTDGKSIEPMVPWYFGFKGLIEPHVEKGVVCDRRYVTRGTFQIVNDNTLRITELPIHKWTEDYKKFLDNKVSDDPKKDTAGKYIEKYLNDSGNNNVDFTVVLKYGVLQDMIKKNNVEDKFNLTTKLNTLNMNFFDYDSQTIKKYSGPEEVLTSFYDHRIVKYEMRKKYYTRILENDMLVAKYRKEFIKMIITDKIILKNKSEVNVNEQLDKHKFPMFAIKVSGGDDDDKAKSYNYLTNMPLKNLTKEKIEDLDRVYQEKKDELNKYKNTPVIEIWRSELNELLVAYKKWNAARIVKMNKLKDKKKGKDKQTNRSKKSDTIKVRTIRRSRYS